MAQDKNIDDIEWEPMETGTWKYEKEGDSIAGILVDKLPGNKEKEISPRYILDTKEGLMMVWGSAIIDDRLRLVKIGTPIKIIYKGQDDIGKGKKLNKFRIMVPKKTDKQVDNTDIQDPDPVQIEDIEKAPSGVATGADIKSE